MNFPFLSIYLFTQIDYNLDTLKGAAKVDNRDNPARAGTDAEGESDAQGHQPPLPDTKADRERKPTQ